MYNTSLHSSRSTLVLGCMSEIACVTVVADSWEWMWCSSAQFHTSPHSNQEAWMLCDWEALSVRSQESVMRMLMYAAQVPLPGIAPESG